MMTIYLYRLNDDKDGWDHIATVAEDGEFTPHTEFANELEYDVNRYDLPEERDEFLRHFGGPYLRAEIAEDE